MVKGKKEKEKNNQLQFQLEIMKALGWYLNLQKGRITQKTLAEKMNIDAALISRNIISPKDADSINADNYIQKNKRLIEISRAMEICEQLDTTLQNVIYYYQFKEHLDNITKIDILKKLPNELTGSEKIQEKLPQDLEIAINTIQQKQEGSETETVSSDVNKLIMNADHPDFLPWFGKYYCYFSSTSSEEAGKKRKELFDRSSNDPELQELLECSTDEYIFCGIMNICSPMEFGDDFCHVNFKFLSNPSECLVKRYSGILILSANTRAVFCELASEDQGEKTYFILEKQDLGKEQPHVRCCMAMVLTYSSKVHRRRPCCERMIISNVRIEEDTEEYEVMKAYLRMNDSTIRITQWGYNELIKDIEQSSDSDLQKIAESFPDLHSLNGKNVTIESCAFIPESIIYTLNSLSDAQKRKFEVLLRNHSIAPWYSKTKATKADTLFKLLNMKSD